MIIIEIAGHLGVDPETRFTSGGQKVTTLRVATKVRKGGNDETVWWRVTIWGDRFDKMMPYFKKGSAIIVIGEMGKPEIYTDREGRPQISLELTAEMIRFSPFGKPESKAGQEAQPGANMGRSPYTPSPAANNTGSLADAPFAGTTSTFGSSTSSHEDQEDQIPF